jgi:hypothetical protein
LEEVEVVEPRRQQLAQPFDHILDMMFPSPFAARGKCVSQIDRQGGESRGGVPHLVGIRRELAQNLRDVRISG